jgi:NAD(P)-dependent dehydrogenase (short-subunit alcohol dehydrogenase family)
VTSAAGGGSIISIASVSGIAGGLRYAAYNASKGGLITLTKGVALDTPSTASAPTPLPRPGRDADERPSEFLAPHPRHRWRSADAGTSPWWHGPPASSCANDRG